MKLLITSEDVYNKLNINIAQFLRIDGQPNASTAVEHFLEEIESDVKEYIGAFAYRGRAGAEWYFEQAKYTQPLREALFAQVQYVCQNGRIADYGGIMMTNGAVNRLSISERVQSNIAPKTHTVLENANLLYRGVLL